MKKVFVSGCFDLLHSGHVEFFRQASKYGKLYVSVGSDKTVYELKDRIPFNDQKERLFMVKAIRYVYQAFIAKGGGMLDYLDDLKRIKPDIFIVNEDGDKPEKAVLCKDLKIRYLVLKRIPAPGLPQRSTTKLRDKLVKPPEYSKK